MNKYPILHCWNARQALKDGKDLTVSDRAIMVVSDPLVHTEFDFSDRIISTGYSSFSATMRNDADCCRFENIDFRKYPKRWAGLVLPMTAEQELKGYEYAKSIEGKPYDFKGLLSLTTEWDIIKPNPNAYWCSEADGGVIKACYGWGEDFIPHEYHPTGLFFEVYHRLQAMGVIVG
jgi:hypothetical protein